MGQGRPKPALNSFVNAGRGLLEGPDQHWRRSAEQRQTQSLGAVVGKPRLEKLHRRPDEQRAGRRRDGGQKFI